MAIRRAAALNPSTPRSICEALQQAGASADLTRSSPPVIGLSAKQVGQLVALGGWAEQLALMQPEADACVLGMLASSPRTTLRRQVAQHANTSQATLTRLAFDRDVEVRRCAAGHRLAPEKLLRLASQAEARSNELGPEQLEELASCGPWGRALAARHPHTGNALLQQLSEDTDWHVRTGIVHHPAATTAMLKPLHVLGLAEVNLALAAHPQTPSEVLALLAGEPCADTRRRVAEHPQTPGETLVRLIEDADHQVRDNACKNPHTPMRAIEQLRRAQAQQAVPGAVLETLAKGGHYARQIAAQHPDTPAASLHQLAADRDPFIREQISRRGGTPIEMIRLGSSADLQGRGTPDSTLSADAIQACMTWGPWARMLAARHPNTTPALLTELSQDEHWQARRNVARHAQTPDAALIALSGDSASDVRWSVVRRGRLPALALCQLAKDEHAAVRLEVALHHDTPLDVIQQLGRDQDAQVRDAARSREKTI